MRCEDTIELMSQSIDGCLDAGEQELLDAHLERCPGCAEAFEALKASVALLRAEAPVQAPGDLAARVREELDSRPVRFPVWNIYSHPQLKVAMAACVVLVVCIFAVVRFPREAGLKPVSELRGVKAYRAGAEQLLGEDKDGLIGVGAEMATYEAEREETEEAPVGTEPQAASAESQVVEEVVELSEKLDDLDEIVASKAEKDVVRGQFEAKLEATRALDKKKDVDARQSLNSFVESQHASGGMRQDVASLRLPDNGARAPVGRTSPGAIWQEARPASDVGSQLRVGREGRKTVQQVPAVMPTAVASASEVEDAPEDLDLNAGGKLENAGPFRKKAVAGEAKASTSLVDGALDDAVAEGDAVAFARAPSSPMPLMANEETRKRTVVESGRLGQSGQQVKIALDSKKDRVESIDARAIQLRGSISVRDEVMRVLSGGVSEAHQSRVDRSVADAFSAKRRAVVKEAEFATPVSGPMSSRRLIDGKNAGEDIVVEIQVARLATVLEELKTLGVVASAEVEGFDQALASGGVVQVHIFLTHDALDDLPAAKE